MKVDVAHLQSKRNADSRDGWECFASHRAHVTRLLLNPTDAADSSLCVLGAGNCNDIDLQQLAAAYSQIDLVDIDGDAIVNGVARQGVAANEAIHCHSIDVTGVANLLSAWEPSSPASAGEVVACIQTAKQSRLEFDNRQFTTVASVCLLSQLLESVMLSVEQSHPQFLELLTCVRREHLRLALDLVQPGGSFVLVTDIVSSVTLPQLDSMPMSELPRLVREAIEQRNFFTGMNPAVITNILQTDPDISSQLSDLCITNPWLWDLGPRRYAVCGFTARRM